jgi:hypothetical protein
MMDRLQEYSPELISGVNGLLGSGENYIGDCIPLIGVEFINMLGDTLHSVIISRGPRKRQTEEKHPTEDISGDGILYRDSEILIMNQLQ